MGGHHNSTKDFWGYLIQPDKSPTPLFRSLLLGIAQYITKEVAPWEVKTLTPIKLASFYRLCGGNCDGLFLETPNATIAFIYKSLGCYHSLQPSKDPFAAPSIPALTNDGFVRWQTVQLLLGPEEHVPFLQKAVKRFEIKNPYDGELFPRSLPADALPCRPDPEMSRWHEQVSQLLLMESSPDTATPRTLHHPHHHNIAAALAKQQQQQQQQHGRGLSEAESVSDSFSSTSTGEDSSIVDAADYFTGATSRRPNSFRRTSASHSRSPPNQQAPASLQAPPPGQGRRHSVPDQPHFTPPLDTATTPRVPPPSQQPQPQHPPAFRQPSYDSQPTSPPEQPSPSPTRPRRPPLAAGRSHSHSPHPRRSHSGSDAAARSSPPHRAGQHSSGDLPHSQMGGPDSPLAPRKGSAYGPQEVRTHGSADAAAGQRAHITLSPQFYGAAAGSSRPQNQAAAVVQGQVPPQPLAQQAVPPMQQRQSLSQQQQQQAWPPPPQALQGQMGPPPPPGAFARGALRNTVHGTRPHIHAVPLAAKAPGPPGMAMPVGAVPAGGQLPLVAVPPGGVVPPTGVPPGAAPGAAAAGPGVRFSDEAPGASRGERMRRRTMEEMARERQREERLEYEAGRRRARRDSTRRSRSGDDR